ncbi:uncharacterized protein PV07_10530 [Cladophialophora immunda]|uniref:Uncharacterized protein n=1 Tax=Cladophialophora immunda TaxID=569365 RepID=A0A0D2AIV8_9EURO|nr:uncharacterized protein PV07_10530 [Cladophialophora immunda]KIW24842.1 hypothetical protein PV07_10530 [Cladophialophora immunda]
MQAPVFVPDTLISSPDGSCLATADDSNIHLWSLKTGKWQKTLKGHCKLVNHIAFSPDGVQVASASDDGSVRVWEVATGDCRYILGVSDETAVKSVAFSPNGAQVASAASDEMVRVWDLRTGDCRHTLHTSPIPVRSAVFSPDGSRVALALMPTLGQDRLLKIAETWALQTDRRTSHSCPMVVRTTYNPVLGECSCLPEATFRVVFSTDGSRVAACIDDIYVAVWDVLTGELLFLVDPNIGILCTGLESPDESSKTLRLKMPAVSKWDAQAQIFRPKYSRSDIPLETNGVVLSPEGSQIILCLSNDIVQVWNISTQQCVEGTVPSSVVTHETSPPDKLSQWQLHFKIRGVHQDEIAHASRAIRFDGRANYLNLGFVPDGTSQGHSTLSHTPTTLVKGARAGTV